MDYNRGCRWARARAIGALACLASEQNKLRSDHAPERGGHVRERGSSVEKRHETRLGRWRDIAQGLVSRSAISKRNLRTSSDGRADRLDGTRGIKFCYNSTRPSLNLFMRPGYRAIEFVD